MKEMAILDTRKRENNLGSVRKVVAFRINASPINACNPCRMRKYCIFDAFLSAGINV
jgi:hypothetical protein